MADNAEWEAKVKGLLKAELKRRGSVLQSASREARRDRCVRNGT